MLLTFSLLPLIVTHVALVKAGRINQATWDLLQVMNGKGPSTSQLVHTLLMFSTSLAICATVLDPLDYILDSRDASDCTQDGVTRPAPFGTTARSEVIKCAGNSGTVVSMYDDLLVKTCFCVA